MITGLVTGGLSLGASTGPVAAGAVVDVWGYSGALTIIAFLQFGAVSSKFICVKASKHTYCKYVRVQVHAFLHSYFKCICILNVFK